MSSLPQHPTTDTGTCHTRGLNPLAAMSYVVEHGGKDAVARVLGRLAKEDLDLLLHDDGSFRITDRDWVPFFVHARLLRAIDAELGYGDLAILPEVGTYMAKRDLPKVFGPILRLGNPGWIFIVATKAWRSYHDKGRWEVERTQSSFVATLRGHPDFDEAFCRTLRGWLHVTIPNSKNRTVKTAHPACRTRGAPHCIFTVQWE